MRCKNKIAGSGKIIQVLLTLLDNSDNYATLFSSSLTIMSDGVPLWSDSSERVGPGFSG